MRLHEYNFYRVYDMCRLLFACSKGISLTTLDQGYTTNVSEVWLSDEDLYTITIEPIIFEPFDLELGEVQMWGVIIIILRPRPELNTQVISTPAGLPWPQEDPQP